MEVLLRTRGSGGPVGGVRRVRCAGNPAAGEAAGKWWDMDGGERPGQPLPFDAAPETAVSLSLTRRIVKDRRSSQLSARGLMLAARKFCNTKRLRGRCAALDAPQSAQFNRRCGQCHSMATDSNSTASPLRRAK